MPYERRLATVGRASVQIPNRAPPAPARPHVRPVPVPLQTSVARYSTVLCFLAALCAKPRNQLAAFVTCKRLCVMIGIGILGAPDEDHSAAAFRTESEVRRVGTRPIIITRHGFCPPRTNHPIAYINHKVCPVYDDKLRSGDGGVLNWPKRSSTGATRPSA